MEIADGNCGWPALGLLDAGSIFLVTEKECCFCFFVVVVVFPWSKNATLKHRVQYNQYCTLRDQSDWRIFVR